jgi:hypothetical protein
MLQQGVAGVAAGVDHPDLAAGAIEAFGPAGEQVLHTPGKRAACVERRIVFGKTIDPHEVRRPRFEQRFTNQPGPVHGLGLKQDHVDQAQGPDRHLDAGDAVGVGGRRQIVEPSNGQLDGGVVQRDVTRTNDLQVDGHAAVAVAEVGQVDGTVVQAGHFRLQTELVVFLHPERTRRQLRLAHQKIAPVAVHAHQHGAAAAGIAGSQCHAVAPAPRTGAQDLGAGAEPGRERGSGLMDGIEHAQAVFAGLGVGTDDVFLGRPGPELHPDGVCAVAICPAARVHRMDVAGRRRVHPGHARRYGLHCVALVRRWHGLSPI